MIYLIACLDTYNNRFYHIILYFIVYLLLLLGADRQRPMSGPVCPAQIVLTFYSVFYCL